MEWTSADRVKLAVWLEEEADKCSRCGTFTWQWQYEDEDGRLRQHTHPPLEVGWWTCYGCRDMDEQLDGATDKGRQPLPPGRQLRWFPADHER